METETLEVLTDDIGGGSLEQIERASIDIQIATAHKFPRTISKVKSDMLSFATLDEETAAACFYSLPRAGKTIQGPSVRLAEIAISCYGNLRAGFRCISTVSAGDNPHVVLQAYTMDLEKNTAISIEKRRRITKKKSKSAVDEDDINLATNACASIALRDAVFRVIPGALIKPIFDACRKVAVGDVKSLVAKRTKILARLAQMGASEDRVLAAVDAASVEDIGLAQLETLIGLGTALKEGSTTLEEAFPARPKFFSRPQNEGTGPPMFTPSENEKPDDVPMDYPTGQPPAVSTVETVLAGGQPEFKIRTTHEQLEESLRGGGITYDELKAWATENNHYKNADIYPTLQDLPNSIAQKLLNQVPGLLKQLSKLKGEKK